MAPVANATGGHHGRKGGREVSDAVDRLVGGAQTGIDPDGRRRWNERGDEFLEEVLPRLHEVEKAIHDGNIEPRVEMWSRDEPLSLLGAAGMCNSGWDEILPTFEWLETVFSNCQEYRFELIAAGASGDLAYTVGLEHATYSMRGEPPRPNTLRVTQIYRREGDEWKVVHRHGDGLKEGQLS